MRLLIVVIFLGASVSSLANAPTANPQDCFKIEDDLDRKYCLDKHLSVTSKTFAAETKTWAKGLSGHAKAEKQEEIEDTIALKKEYVAFIQSEIAQLEKHEAELKTVKELSPPPAKKKKEKKKKSKGLFGIKL